MEKERKEVLSGDLIVTDGEGSVVLHIPDATATIDEGTSETTDKEDEEWPDIKSWPISGSGLYRVDAAERRDWGKELMAELYGWSYVAESMYGDELKEKLKFYIDDIKLRMEKFNLDLIIALMETMKDPRHRESYVAKVMFMAAALEIIESEECKTDS